MPLSKGLKKNDPADVEWKPSQIDLDWRYLTKKEFVAKYPEFADYWRVFCECGYSKRFQSDGEAMVDYNFHMEKNEGHKARFRKYEQITPPELGRKFSW